MSAPGDMANAIATLMENMAPIREACSGYRKSLEAEGWSPTAAEQMALAVHEGMVRMVFSVAKR